MVIDPVDAVTEAVVAHELGLELVGREPGGEQVAAGARTVLGQCGAVPVTAKRGDPVPERRVAVVGVERLQRTRLVEHLVRRPRRVVRRGVRRAI